MKTFSIVLLMFFGVNNFSFSQTVEITDSGLKSCLVDDYPTLVDASEDLIIVEANTYTGSLLCVNKNIKKVDVLEHFLVLDEIDLSNNSIVSATGLGNATTLSAINLNSNELEFVPDFSTFSKLKVFSANYNQLDDYPIFSSSIEEIHLGNNSLSFTWDISELTNVKVLNLFENDVQELTGFEKLVLLEKADLHTNELKRPIDLSGLTLLEDIDLKENEYLDLPTFDLSSSSKLTTVGLSLNMLTFEDFLPFKDLSSFPTGFIDFTNQIKPEVAETITLDEGDSWSWELSFDQTVTSNVYSWYRDNQLISTTTVGRLDIVALALSDAGEYYCEVSNTTSGFEGHTLLTNKKVLIVNEDTTVNPEPDPECFKVINSSHAVEPVSCKEFVNVLLEVELEGRIQGNVMYKLLNKTDTLVSNSGSFVAEKEGEYTIVVVDDSCTVTLADKITIEFDYTNCNSSEPFAFSPNGDGLDDTFYIEKEGLARIYNKRGELVKEIYTPAIWDGTDSNHQLLDLGHYIIIINEKDKVDVTLMR